MTKIIFYFPYQEECGVPVLFLRMSRWLAENHGDEFDVYVGDFADGAMARNLTPNDTVKLCVSGTQDDIVVGNDDILVMQTITPYYFPAELHMSPKAKLFFWTVHFRNLTPSLLPLPGLRELPYDHLWIYRLCSVFYRGLLWRMKKLADDMMANNALCFMDASTEEQTLLHLPLDVPKDMEYLPVPASDYDGALKKYSHKDVIDACWLGRISYEKTPILVHTLEKCSQYAKTYKKKIHFHILGSGEYEDWVNNLPVEHEYFTKTKCAPIKFSEIDSYLLNNIDIMFAMGTSALESAKLGIPTILVDCTATESPIDGDYIFRYLYNRKNYDLGHVIGPNDICHRNKSLDDILDNFEVLYEENSQSCRRHFVEKHSLTSVGSKFYNIITNMTFTFDMINPRVIQRPFLLRVYNKLRGFDRFD